MADNYLVITDGTTTVTMMDGSSGSTNYIVASGKWAPKIATLRASTLGGRGPYEEVEEEITLHITDTTAAGCYTRIDTLTRLIEQANRWYKNENVSAVLVKYSPAGATVSSSGTPLQAAILYGSVSLSPDIEFVKNVPYIRNVVLRFTRRGQWLHSATTDASTSTSNGSQANCDMTAALNNVGPTKLSMSDYPSGGSESGFILVTSNDGGDRLALANPTSGSTTNWTTPDESANQAKYTDVLRYTAPDTAESTSGNITLSLSSGNLYAVFASIRNNSSSISYNVRAIMSAPAGGTKTSLLSYTYIPPYTSAAQPQWYFLGLTPYAVIMNLKATASSASGTLDFGAVTAIDVSYKGSSVFTFAPSTTNAVSKLLTIDHQLLTKPSATGSGGDPFDVKGDLNLQTFARNIEIVSMICGASDDWRQESGGVVANTWTAVRYSAYLSPV